MAGQRSMPARRRGGPPTGRGLTIGVRCYDELLSRIDEWRRNEPDQLVSRATAVRRLTELGLKALTRRSHLDSATPQDTRGHPPPMNTLEARRKKLGLSRVELASILDVDRVSIYRHELHNPM